jgi:uncharacterized membrane protein HdeD (DUF308 family)
MPATANPVVRQTINELWWMGAIQGTAALFFGISALFWPALSLLTLVYLFSAFVIGLGFMEALQGIMSINRRSTWWVTLLIGLVNLGIGVYLVRHLDVSISTFTLLIGLLLVARGILDVVRSFGENASTGNKVLQIVAGAAAVIAGIVIMLQPVAGGVAFVWVLGLYALLYGALTLAISFELRNELQALLSKV